MTFPTDVPADAPQSRTVTVRQRVANDPTKYVIDMGDGISGPEIGFYPGPLALTPGQRVRAEWNKDMWQWQLTGPGLKQQCDVAVADYSKVGTDSSDQAGAALTAANDFVMWLDSGVIQVFTFDTSTGLLGVATTDTQATGIGSIQHLALSPNEDYIAVVGSTTPFIEVYAFNNATGAIGAKVPDPATLATRRLEAVAWSPSQNFIAAGMNLTGTESGEQGIFVWNWSAGFGSKLPGPGTPTWAERVDAVFHIFWNPAETAVIVSTDWDFAAVNKDPFTAYAWSPAGFGSRLSGRATQQEHSQFGAFSSDGTYVCFADSTASITAHGEAVGIHTYPFSPTTGFGTEVPIPSCGPNENATHGPPMWFNNDRWILYPAALFGGRDSGALYGLISFNKTSGEYGSCCTPLTFADTPEFEFADSAFPLVSADEQWIILPAAPGSLSFQVSSQGPTEGLSISDLLNVSIT